MSGFHFQPRHVLQDFQAPLQQIQRYLEHLVAPEAPVECVYAVTEIALDMVDFCSLQEQLTPAIASEALARIRGVMQTLVRVLGEVHSLNPEALLGPIERDFIKRQSICLNEILRWVYGHGVASCDAGLAA